MTFHYFYKIENIINGKFYYGVHKTNNLDDGYMGSGTRIIRAITKYGIENFRKNILLYFDSFDEALEYESEIVNEELLLDPSCYNIRLGGESHWHYYNKHKLNIHHKKKGRATWLDLDTNKKITAKNSDENEIFRQSNRYVGLTKGKLPVKDINNKVFLVDINDERYLSGKLKQLFFGKKHSEKTKKLMSYKHQQNKDQQKEKNSQFGTCWITNGKENKKIKKGGVIPDGWKLGRKIK
jgi:hypothetical protein